MFSTTMWGSLILSSSSNAATVIVSDPRGIGKSEGVWKLPFTKQEVQDCYDIIEWAAKEDWCDGNVGMMAILLWDDTAIGGGSTPTPFKSDMPLGNPL